MANHDIREAMRKAGVRQWQVAYRYGLNDGNFCRLLRAELPAEKKERIFRIIEEIQTNQVVGA